MILLPDLRAGGAEWVHLLLVEQFIRIGYEVELVLLRARGELLDQVPSGVSLVDLKCRRLRQAFLPLVRYLKQRRPDMLLAAMWPMTGLAALANRLTGSHSRLIVSEHNVLSHTPAYRGWSGRVHRLFGAWFYGLTDGVVCVSQGVREDIVAQTNFSANHTHVIYNPVRRPIQSEPSFDAAIAQWWNAGGDKLIAIGTLKAQKDFPGLLHAIAILLRNRKARLLILGDGSLRAELELLIATLGLEDFVKLPGFVSDPYPYLEQADLFVLSSAWEGFGNVILEALVCGAPVVSTDCPSGPAEILENGKYGRLVPVGDPEALAAAMAEALDAVHDHDLLRRRGAEFSVERAADQYLTLLDPAGFDRRPL